MSQPTVTQVSIPLEIGRLEGELSIPDKPLALVLFVHGSGHRENPQNKAIASALHAQMLATLSVELLTPVEDSRQGNRFNVELLSERLALASDWARKQPSVPESVGYFGTGTGAAAALRCAAHSRHIKAVVIHGGRPDLAGTQTLCDVTAPCLLVVGGRDSAAIAMGRQAFSKLQCEKQMLVVPGATERFEHPGTLEQVVSQAGAWFSRHLAA